MPVPRGAIVPTPSLAPREAGPSSGPCRLPRASVLTQTGAAEAGQGLWGEASEEQKAEG